MFGPEHLLLLHQRPCNDKHLRRHLHPYLRTDPLLSLPSGHFVGEVPDKRAVLRRCDKRCLIEAVPEVGLSLLRYHDRHIVSLPAPVAGQVKPCELEHLPVIVKAVGVTERPYDLCRYIGAEPGDAQEVCISGDLFADNGYLPVCPRLTPALTNSR